MHRVEVEITPKCCRPLVGGEFIDSISTGTVFCSENGLLWVKLDGKRRAMYLDGTGTITSSDAAWGTLALHVVTKLRAEY